MARGKSLLMMGISLATISLAILAYTCFQESAMRKRARAPSGTDFGFVPIDLLIGRTRFEKREADKVVFWLDAGPMAGGRIAMTRAAFPIGLVGAALILFAIRKQRV